MRSRIILGFAPPALVALAWACGNDGSPAVIVGDAGPDVSLGGDDSSFTPDGGTLPDVVSSKCKLDDKTDPVSLCVQQQIIGFELQYAYSTGHGVAPGWSSASPYAAVSGHDWHDDLGLAGSLGAYLCNAQVYGNNTSSAAVNAALTDLGGVLVPELQQSPPTGYDGEIYFRLRWAQAAYNYGGDPNAATLAAMADAYGAALAAQAYTVAPSGGGSGGDGGADGGGDGGSGGGSPGGVVIGTKNADGSVSYAPTQAVMAAAALLDLANLQTGTPDAGPVQSWAATAQQVIAYVLARGRDPVTGLFYQSLTTSSDPGHDAVGPGAPTNDTMLSETQAWVLLGLARAQDLLTQYQSALDGGVPDTGAVDTAPYWTAGNALAAAMTTAGLFDGNPSPPPAPAPFPVGAFMEGLVLSGSQMLTDKPTIANAVMLGGFHRVAQGQGSPLLYERPETVLALTQQEPAGSSFLTVVTDSNGSPDQQSFLRATSKGFGYAVAVAPGSEGGGQGEEQGARNYRSDAVHAVMEGLTQLWHGTIHDTHCAP